MLKALMLVGSVQLLLLGGQPGNAANSVLRPVAASDVACPSAGWAHVADTAVRGSPTWRTISLGTYPSVSDLRQALKDDGCKVGSSAEAALADGSFTISKSATEVDLIFLSVAQLGFGPEGATPAELYARAMQLGFKLCPAEIGPQLRLQYRDQPVGEYLRIAMEPIATDKGAPVVFIVGNGGAGLMLLGAEVTPGFVAPSMIRYVFVRP